MHDDDARLGEYLGAFSSSDGVRQQPRFRSTALGRLGAGQTQPDAGERALIDADREAYLKRIVAAGKVPETSVTTASMYKINDVPPNTQKDRWSHTGPQIKVKGVWVDAQKFPVRDLRSLLNQAGANAGSGLLFDAPLIAGWKTYNGMLVRRSSAKPGPIALAPDNAGWVFIQPTVLATLRASAKAWPAKYGTAAPKATAGAAPAASGNVSVSTNEIQKIMIALGVDPKNITDGKYGPTTKSKWAAATKARGLTSTSSGKSGATTATVDAKALAAMRAAATAAAPVATTDQVISTAEAQGLLAALGFTAAGTALTDGLFGKSTSGAWAEAAAKRKLDPFMAKKTADGKQVVVRKNTYLMIKADADAKVSPREPTSLKQMDPKLIAVTTGQEMELLLSKLSPGTGTIEQRYAKAANARSLDARIEPTGANWVVLRATLDRLVADLQKMAPSPPPGPPTRQSNVKEAMLAVAKSATVGVPVSTVRKALNAAIQAGSLKATPFTKDVWVSSMAAPLAEMESNRAPGDKTIWKDAWIQSLVPGVLVSADEKTVKTTPAVATALRDLAARFTAAVKAEVDRFKGYTKVSAAEVIARINNLGVSTKKFDRAGGSIELTDAIKTFIENTGGKAPAGNLVVTETKDPHSTPYVKNDVLLALALAVKAADERAKKTKAFRDNMVAQALKAATVFLPVRDLQQAIKHSVLTEGTSGPNKKLFGAVKVTGAFDAPTRAAYTEIARTVTIGPLVQEYQALLQKQLGPRFQTALVTEARSQVWNTFLDKAVQKKDGKLSVAMLPALGISLAGLAARYRKTITEDKAHDEQLAADRKTLSDAVKKSTAILSMVNVQQALLQLAKTEGRTRDQIEIKPTGVKITGLADKQTRDGLYQLTSLIFPEGYDLPETTWVAYLKAVGIKVVPGGKPVRAWVDSNYIALPPDLANKLAKAAGDWIAAHGPAQVKIVEFKNPSIITVVVPKKKEVLDFTKKEDVKEAVKEKAKEVVSEPAPTGDADKARAAREQAERDKQAAAAAAQAQQAAAAAEAAKQAELLRQQAERDRLAKEQAAAAAAAAQQAAREAELRAQAAQQAGRARDAERAAADAQRAAAVAQAQMQAAQQAAAREQAGRQQAAAQDTAAAGGAATGGGAQITGPSITGPTINITAPAPVKEAGMGVGGIAALIGAAIALASFASKGGDSAGAGE